MCCRDDVQLAKKGGKKRMLLERKVPESTEETRKDNKEIMMRDQRKQTATYDEFMNNQKTANPLQLHPAAFVSPSAAPNGVKKQADTPERPVYHHA